jgi:hypothetical protein
MVGKDTLWKGIIEDLAGEFVRYFFPDAEGIIDFQSRSTGLFR